MKTFDKNGHITDEGFALLTAGEPEELLRYELAEHLDYCDLCVDRYSLLLSGETMLTVPEDLSESVMAGIRRRAITIFTSQAAKVCAAACLAIVIWCGGIFGDDITARGEQLSKKVAAGGTSLSQMAFGVGDAIGNWLNGFSINARGENFGTEKQ